MAAGKRASGSSAESEKPLTPFRCFARERRRAARKGAKDAGFTKADLKAEWKAMAKPERAKYRAAAQASGGADASAAKKAAGKAAKAKKQAAKAAAADEGSEVAGGTADAATADNAASAPAGAAPSRAERRKQFWEAKRKSKRDGDDGEDGDGQGDAAVHGSRESAASAATSPPTPAASPGAAASAAEDSGAASGDKPRKRRRRGASNTPEPREPKKRYLLFVGNMAYKTKLEDVYKHFGRFGGLIDVRMRTDKKTKKFLGTCFVEYDSREPHGKALGLHHSKLCGRVINVELTVGGGGKSERRMEKLKEKNKRHLGIGGPESVNAIPLGPRKVR